MGRVLCRLQLRGPATLPDRHEWHTGVGPGQDSSKDWVHSAKLEARAETASGDQGLELSLGNV